MVSGMGVGFGGDLLGMGYQTMLYWGCDVVRQPLVVWYPMGVREEFLLGWRLDGEWRKFLLFEFGLGRKCYR